MPALGLHHVSDMSLANETLIIINELVGEMYRGGGCRLSWRPSLHNLCRITLPSQLQTLSHSASKVGEIEGIGANFQLVSHSALGKLGS